MDTDKVDTSDSVSESNDTSLTGTAVEVNTTEIEYNEKLTKVSHDLFDKLSSYVQTELSGTKDTYALLQELNEITLDQYKGLSHSTAEIKDSLKKLDMKYKLLLPYLEQINQIDMSVASLEQATIRLDAYTKVLESKFRKLEKR